MLRLVDELPPELITIGGADYTDFVSGTEGLRTALRTWDAHGATESYESRRYAAAVTKLRAVLSKLPDSAVPVETDKLLFVTDTHLRQSIRSDIAYAERALAGSDWKPATVFAGAAVEALLLWAIEQCAESDVQASISKLKSGGKVEAKMSNKPEDWPLGILRQVAADLGIIKRAADNLVKIAQGFRNFIHPGAARRLQERCTKSTAHTAVAALSRVVEDLS